MKKLLLPALVLCACTFTAKDAFAWFQICNHRTDGLWSSYSYYVPATSTIHQECQESGNFGGCYDSAWRTVGWWRIEPNQCATVLGAAITNRYSYVYVESDLGGRLSGANVSFYVTNPAYSWEEYVQLHYTSGECFGSIGIGDFCTPEGYNVLFKQIDTTSFTNFILNIT
jgi:uncharacterized membrane protein